MFTWICPKCGAEVPPAYDECPRCSPPKAHSEPPPATVSAPPPVPAEPARPAAETAAATAAPPVAPTPTPAPAQPMYQAPPPYEPPPPPVQGTPAYSYPSPAPIAPKKPMPAWLAAVATAGGMLVILAILYLWVIPSRHNGHKAEAAAQQPAALENVSQPKPGDSPYAKDLEVAGFRISEDKTQRVQIRFLVINHSGAELPPLKGQISLKAGAANSIIDFPFTLPSMAPYESREITSSTKTTVRAYELPDWQFIKPDFWVTESQH